jgi:peptide/nickel transport system permease protein
MESRDELSGSAVGSKAGPNPVRSVLSDAGTVGQGPTTWTRFRAHRLALIGMICLLLLVFLSVAAPLFAQDPYATDFGMIRQPPSTDHWLGTDDVGRDVFSRLMYAGRVSLSVGIVAVLIFTLIGIVLGALAGFYGGWIDSLIMRLADIVLSFPTLVIIIVVVAVLGPSIFNVMIAIGILGWPQIARLLRGDLLSLRERDFVLAARSIGASDGMLVLRHLLPNALAPIIVASTIGVASAILLEAALSFLGLGVQAPQASWGNMLNRAQSLTVLADMPWLWIPPGVMIATAVLAINFVGDGLRDALDPFLRHR